MTAFTMDVSVREHKTLRSKSNKNAIITKIGTMKKIKQILQWLQEVQDKVNEIQAKSAFGKM